MLNTAVQNHFNSLKKQSGKFKRQTKHRQSLVTLSRRSDLVKSKLTIRVKVGSFTIHNESFCLCNLLLNDFSYGIFT